MAGTFDEQAELSVNATFVNRVRVAMIKRGIENYFSQAAQGFTVLEQSRAILRNGGADCQLVAWLTVAGTPAIASAAPAVPADATVQSSVNAVLTALLK